MKKSYIPAGYAPALDAYDTQRAIAFIKQTFQEEEFSGHTSGSTGSTAGSNTNTR